MKFFAISIMLLFGCIVQAQKNTIIGIVIDADNKISLNGSNVFLSNTSKGTATDTSGKFILNNIPDGKFLQLVVSSVGYETFTYTFSSQQLPLNLKISLNKKIVEMEGVVIIPYEVNGWEKWGKTFMDNFLGQSDNAFKCEIDNPKQIKFRRNKKDDTLEAESDGMFIIRNYNLGYAIKYQLDKFVMDFKHSRVSYTGYPLFMEMEPNEPLAPEYKWKRAIAYKGSMMHFIRSLYADKLKEEGFEVRRMELLPTNDTIINDGKTMHHFFTIDSMGKRKSPPYIVNKAGKEKIDTFLLTKDSIVFKDNDSVSNVLSFNNYLVVHYLNESEPEFYSRRNYATKARDYQLSKFSILNDDKKILIEPDGYYSPALDLFMEGYLSAEKMGDFLPWDYVPDK
ncbi:MAG: carboxypeptidase-like regulatory domain-containing protein [Ferruginibacter sp.]